MNDMKRPLYWSGPGLSGAVGYGAAVQLARGRISAVKVALVECDTPVRCSVNECLSLIQVPGTVRVR
jgi:hypothetical protein